MTIHPTLLAIATVFGIIVSALLAFWWAGRSGQFHEVERGAMALFDADEIVEGKIEPEGQNDHSHI
ncbi:MAG: cbb3-type cytochrome oxidase assembly protein CcoS [Akkermansiaceae bacterium]